MIQFHRSQMHLLKIESMTTLVVRYFTLQIPPSHHSLDETIVRAHSSDMPLSCRASFCCGCVQLQYGSIIAYEVYVSSPYNPVRMTPRSYHRVDAYGNSAHV
eukprot:884537_1